MLHVECLLQSLGFNPRSSFELVNHSPVQTNSLLYDVARLVLLPAPFRAHGILVVPPAEHALVGTRQRRGRFHALRYRYIHVFIKVQQLLIDISNITKYAGCVSLGHKCMCAKSKRNMRDKQGKGDLSVELVIVILCICPTVLQYCPSFKIIKFTW